MINVFPNFEFFSKFIFCKILGCVRNRMQVTKTLVYSKHKKMNGLAFTTHTTRPDCLKAVFHKLYKESNELQNFGETFQRR